MYILLVGFVEEVKEKNCTGIMYAYFTFKLYLNLKIFNSVNLVAVNEHTPFVTSQSKENG